MIVIVNISSVTGNMTGKDLAPQGTRSFSYQALRLFYIYFDTEDTTKRLTYYLLKESILTDIFFIKPRNA